MQQIMSEIQAKREGAMDGENQREEIFQIDTDQLWFVSEDNMDQRWHRDYKNLIPNTSMRIQDADSSLVPAMRVCRDR
jgi:hypothetical protein